MTRGHRTRRRDRGEKNVSEGRRRARTHAHRHPRTYAHARTRPANQARRPHARARTRSLRPTPRAAEASSSSHALSQSRNVLCSLVTRSLGMKRWVARGMKPCISIFFFFEPVAYTLPSAELFLGCYSNTTMPLAPPFPHRWHVSYMREPRTMERFRMTPPFRLHRLHAEAEDVVSSPSPPPPSFLIAS